MDKNNVKIIVGSHGSGKSNWIYNYFFSNAVKDGKIDLRKKFYLIVPEQDTNDRQRLLMQIAGEKGFGYGIINMDVVSYDRIAHEVFGILNIEPEAKNVIDDDAKTMILELTLSKLQREKKLRYYSKMVHKVGFAKKLTQVVSEFRAYRIGDEEIEKVIKESSNDKFKDKLRDLILIYDTFAKDIEAKHFSIKEDKYNLLCDNIDKVDIFDGAYVAFDGFTGFTPVQMEIFRKIADKAKEVYVTIDERSSSISDTASIFGLSKIFIDDISKTLEKSKKSIKNTDYIYTDSVEKYKGRPDLLHIEKHIFDYAQNVDKVKAENIDIYAAKNADDEVRNVVDQIKKLVTENDYRYSDIKILVPSIEDYKDRLLRTFNKASIPLFIDDTTSLLNSPYIETIRSALDVVYFDFSYDSVMRYIDAGIIEKTEYVNMLDNLILKYGIRGYKRYKNGFDKIYIDDKYKDTLLSLKDEIFGPLFSLYEDLKDEDKAISYIEVISKYIENVQLDKKFEDFCKSFDERLIGDNDYNRQAKILSVSIETTKKVFDNIKTICKGDDALLSLNDFKKLLDIGFTEKGVKSIPYLLDQVVVGDLMRSRFDNPKVQFFIGLNLSKIPSASTDSSLIDDDMRAKFSACNIKLSQTTEETTLNQRFYIYLALTNPTEKMILSYPRLNANGDSDEKSPVILAVERLLIGDNIEKVVAYDDVYGVRKSVVDDTNIDDALATRLIDRAGAGYSSSVSSIECFNGCPYRYFLERSMSLSEREVYEISHIDMGNYFHKIMELIYKKGVDIDKAQDDKYVEGLIDDAVKKIENDTDMKDRPSKFFDLNKSEKDFYGSNKLTFVKERAKKVLILAIKTLSKIQAESKLKCRSTEENFNHEIDDKRFNGKIDRIEEYVDGDTLYISVLDYKSGKQSISIDDIKAGVKIQLITYLDYCKEKYLKDYKEVIPCGSFYFRIADPIIKVDSYDDVKDIENVRMQELSYVGIVNEDPDAVAIVKPDLSPKIVKDKVASYSDGKGFKIIGVVGDIDTLSETIGVVHEKISETVEDIKNGVIKIKPYKKSNCDYCPYIAVCRKDQTQFATDSEKKDIEAED